MNGNMIMRPWEGARLAGRNGFALLLFFMQISLVFWPAAVRAAQRLQREGQKQALLDQLAALHAPILQEKRAPHVVAVLEHLC
ncbi:hypothetical protein [Acidocella sp.]|uniref:hypothetical protein n=1 Tax=Acidocella sp. TaxID=50710 RepID=UPI00262DD188|nr:hypothetical protein [Acidocella sp.]